MALKQILSLLLVLQLCQQILCQDSSVRRFSGTFEYSVGNNETVGFKSVPTIWNRQNYFALLTCNSAQGHCFLQKYVEPFDYEPRLESNRTCRLEILENHEVDYVDVLFLTPDKIVLDWYLINKYTKEYKRYVTIIQTSDCLIAKTIDVKIIRPNNQVKVDNGIKYLHMTSTDHIVPHYKAGKFDIFYKDFSLCHYGEIHATYNNDGDMVGGRTCFDQYFAVNDKRLTTEADAAIVGNQYFVLDGWNNLWTGFVMNLEGTESRNYKSTEYELLHSQFRISSNYNRVTMCKVSEFENSNVINCKVYRSKNHSAHNLTLTFPYEINIYEVDFEIYNLQQNKLLVLTTYGTHDDETANYHLWTFNHHGKPMGYPINLKGAECIYTYGRVVNYRNFLSKDGDNICVTFGCTQFVTDSATAKVHIATECVGIPNHQENFHVEFNG